MDSLYSYVCLHITGGIWLSLDSILLFYQAIFKLVTKEFSSLVIHDFYWTWVTDQPRSFYQVINRHQFLIVVLC